MSVSAAAFFVSARRNGLASRRTWWFERGCHNESVAQIGRGDFELTMDDLRVVARYAVESAEEVLPLFEEWHPDDRRPRAAVEAAWTFVDGADRSKLQCVTALDAHRAAKDATTQAAKHAAHAAGDAAAAAYLHPLAKAT
jgi:hypothetical protein